MKGQPMERFRDGRIRYVFLDRDGVINRKLPEGQYVTRWSDFHFLQGVESAIRRLNFLGIRVIVISNQRGVSLGLYTAEDVEMIHSKVQDYLHKHHAHIDAFYYCPHDDNQCDCRKPKTGMFDKAFERFPEASGSNSLVIGDSISDIEAARAIGMPSVFIRGNPDTQRPGAEEAAQLADAVCQSLEEFVCWYFG
jgi:D-glycero-D-manno-heptose 1,7-bisphosphate phosphatase